jgi:microcystin-dependent protein
MEEYTGSVKRFAGTFARFAGTFAPSGFLDCDGRLLPISQEQVLFAVIGTQYGPT